MLTLVSEFDQDWNAIFTRYSIKAMDIQT